MLVGITVAVALVGVVLWGTLIGSSFEDVLIVTEAVVVAVQIGRLFVEVLLAEDSADLRRKADRRVRNGAPSTGSTEPLRFVTHLHCGARCLPIASCAVYPHWRLLIEGCRMWKPVTVACVVFFALGANAPPAEACSCVIDPAPPPGLAQAQRTEHFLKAYRAYVRKQFEESYAIFSAEAIAVGRGKVMFRVEDVWKGELPRELTMDAAIDPSEDPTAFTSSCDYFFKSGKKYLVVAYGSSVATMMTKPCTSTGEIPPDRRPMFIRNQTITMLDELVPERLKPRDL